MTSIFLHVQLTVLKIAKSRNEISCSASKHGSYAVFRITIDDVIHKLGSIYSDISPILVCTSLKPLCTTLYYTEV